MLQQWSGVGLHECRSIGVWLVSKGAHLAAEQYLSTLPPTTAIHPASQRWDKAGNNALPPSLISPCEEVFFYQLCQDPLLLGLTNRNFTLLLRFETIPPPLTNHASMDRCPKFYHLRVHSKDRLALSWQVLLKIKCHWLWLMKITLWRTRTFINTTLSHDLTSVKYIGWFPEKALFGFKLKAGADRSLQFSDRQGSFQFVKANIITSTWGKVTVFFSYQHHHQCHDFSVWWILFQHKS